MCGNECNSTLCGVTDQTLECVWFLSAYCYVASGKAGCLLISGLILGPFGLHGSLFNTLLLTDVLCHITLLEKCL